MCPAFLQSQKTPWLLCIWVGWNGQQIPEIQNMSPHINSCPTKAVASMSIAFWEKSWCNHVGLFLLQFFSWDILCFKFRCAGRGRWMAGLRFHFLADRGDSPVRSGLGILSIAVLPMFQGLTHPTHLPVAVLEMLLHLGWSDWLFDLKAHCISVLLNKIDLALFTSQRTWAFNGGTQTQN